VDTILLQIEQLSVSLSGKEILRDITMEIRRGEQWICVGEAGAGKTVFAHALAGHHFYRGLIIRSGDKTAQDPTVLVVDQQHRFRDVRNQSNFYYQQRYNSFDADATISVLEELAEYPSDGFPKLSKDKLLDLFHLRSLLDEPLIQLSNGENKRLQILKALLQAPDLLILDDPFTGLDAEGRQMLDRILTTLSELHQTAMVLTSRFDIPPGVNRFAELNNGRLSVLSSATLLQEKKSVPSKQPVKEFPAGENPSYPEFKFAVQMKNVSVRYEGKAILDGINWEVEKGSCWALTGPNGAGKSTLLSLITADNPQAYANDIYLFDRKRGTGESIWEIKQKIGYLSPELHLYFDPAATVFTSLASGLFDTIGLFRQLSTDQEEYVAEWMKFLDISGYAARLMTSLPAGIQRLVLLGRALVKKPPLLILDEPCQGLDREQTAFTLGLIDRYCHHYGATLIFVSHYASDFPACIRKTLRLNRGKIAN
jgi:molybdate transport system ATP-binding protein